MADYATSTQRQRWTPTAEELAEKRAASSRRAADCLLKHGTTRAEIQADGTLAPKCAEGDGAPPAVVPEPLTLEEEHLLRKYYEVKIQEVCGAFMFPTKIQAAAILFFKRFYMQWSVMERDPKHVMLTCIYLACKTEEVYVSAEAFGKGIQQDPQVVLDNELGVLQTLQFDLVVYAPYRPLAGFLFEMEDFLREEGQSALPEEQYEALRRGAEANLDAAMLTDAPLLYPPGQIALAALMLANEEESRLDFGRYLQHVVGRAAGGGGRAEALLEKLRHVSAMLKGAGRAAPPNDRVRSIDKKLKYCNNPALLAQDEMKKRERKERHKAKKSAAQGEGAP